METTTNPTGHDLKVERVSARVKQAALGAHMGVTYSRVAAIEREQFPSAEIVRRYRSALDMCQNVQHAPEAA